MILAFIFFNEVQKSIVNSNPTICLTNEPIFKLEISLKFLIFGLSFFSSLSPESFNAWIWLAYKLANPYV